MSSRNPRTGARSEERDGPTSEHSLSARSPTSSSLPPPRSFGRYVLHAPIARGGMATIYIARLIGASGFSRLVAAKRLHAHFTEDPDFVAMFHDEARIASKIHHPNVVPVLDVVLEGQEVIIIQEYVHGVPLDKLFKSALLSEESTVPVPVVVALLAGVLDGLHAAHETKDELDEPLHIVHRDVSPDNVIVSLEGVPRLLDFGIAKARSSVHVTREGFFKGKIAYMAPEQLRAEPVTPASDVYSAGVLLWELLAHRRLHVGRGEAELFNSVLNGTLPTLTAALEGTRPWISDERWGQLVRLEPVAARALAKNPAARFPTAAAMRAALLEACPAAATADVAEWVRSTGADYLERRQAVLASSEESWRSHSKIAAARVATGVTEGSGPASLVKLVSRSPGGGILDSVLPSPVAISALRPPGVISSSPDAMRARRLTWTLAASLLVVLGVLIGTLVARTPDTPSPSAATAPAVETSLSQLPSSSAPAPPPTASAEDVAAPLPRPPRPVAPAAPPLPRSTPPAKPSPVLPRAAAPAPPPAAPAAPASAPTAKVDCDPPFYFDGTKKIYKPSCL